MANPKLTRISTSELRRELDRRAAQASTLEVKRVELAKELAQIDAEIAALGGEATASGSGAESRSRIIKRHARRSAAARTRAANEVPLTTALHDVLKGKTMSVGDAAEAVQKAGYKSHAANFPKVVNLTLLKHTDLFTKKGRGQYKAK